MDGYTDEERAILQATVAAGSDGISSRELDHKMSNEFGIREYKEALRSLMQAQKITVTKTNNTTMITAVRAPMTDNFSHVLAVVRQAGTNGVDAPSVMAQTKIIRAEVTKALNTLVQQKQIKETRSFTNKAKKLYILAELDPSNEVTGGTFYNDTRDLDQPFIGSLRSYIIGFVTEQTIASVSQLRKMLADVVPSNRKLSTKEVAIVARSLELDGMLQRNGRCYASPRDVGGHNTAHLASLFGAKSSGGSGSGPLGDSARSVLVDDFSNVMYRLGPNARDSASGADASTQAATTAAIFSPNLDAFTYGCPCISCPLLDVCDPNDNGVVCPKQCAYYAEWLALPSDEKAKVDPKVVVGKKSAAPGPRLSDAK